jgi:pimeloyl-ACP methyl ester carboxylesterase
MKIGLWGRSMGAVAALRYCSIYQDVTVAILDSPFSSLL